LEGDELSTKREIVTFSHKVFDFYRPMPEDICIEDIAHALAFTNRYGGHTRVPYSVAEHCVRMSHIPVGDPVVNLLHDSAEAYIGDIPSPQKKGLCWRLDSGGFGVEYSQVEAEILRQIGKALGIPKIASWLTMPEDTKAADTIMYLTEVRDLMPPQALETFQRLGWIPAGFEPLAGRITPCEWRKAEKAFLYRFEELAKCD
jgi:hypothetical protein